MYKEDDTIKKLRQAMLYLLDETVKILDDNKIDYYLLGGTLLGAVRHGGFIPWDDDLDIGLTRESFDRFVALDINKYNSKLFLQTLHTDKYYSRPHARMKLKGTKIINDISSWSKQNDGISISIFIFDKISNSQKERVKQFKKHKRLNGLVTVSTLDDKKSRINFYLSKSNKGNIFKKIRVKVATYLSFFINRKKIITKFEKNMTKHNKSNYGFYYPFASPYRYSKNIVPEDLLSETAMVLFEGKKYKTVKNPDLYLTHLYGDYMTPPPEKSRKPAHNITNIFFDIK